MFALGVDIGGTKIAFGVVTEDGTIVDHAKVPTRPEDARAIDDAIVAAHEDFAARYDIGAIGIAAAGLVSSDRQTINFGTNIDWRDYPLGQHIAERIGTTVVVENDANAAGWAEYRFGAGQQANTMVALTVGTGLGGAIVLDGQLVRGAWGMGGEIGHMRMVPDGVACPCGQSGCMEQYTSGRALVRRTRRAATADPQAAKELLERGNGTIEGLKGPHITAAAMAGDEFSCAQISELGRWLGIAAASITAILDPALFVIGGGVCAADELLLAPMRAAFAAALPAATNRPCAQFSVAQLGNAAGIVGAADLARTS